jgi:two-component system, NarL family, invasion response regulator UvrY
MSQSKSALILIVDDHQIVREGVRSLFNTVRPAWRVAEASSSEDAVKSINRETPDLIVMDITLPGLSGLETVARLRKDGFKNPVLVFTMHMSRQLAVDVRDAGAQGYVLKSQAVGHLVRAIDTLFAGGTFFNDPEELSDAKNNPKPRFMLLAGLEPAFAW